MAWGERAVSTGAIGDVQQVAVVRGCAAFDLVVTGVFALPPVARLFLRVVFAVNGALGGTAAAPEFMALQWLFVYLTGALGVVWALARLLWPLRGLGIADAVARTWVGCIIALAVFEGAPGILVLFVLTEFAGAALQLAVLTRAPVPTVARA